MVREPTRGDAAARRRTFPLIEVLDGGDGGARCTLPSDDLPHRLDRWHRLRSSATAVTALADGVRLELPTSAATEAEQLAAAEADCCGFLTLVTRRAGDTVVLDITSDHSAGMPVIDVLIGSGGHGDN